MQFNPARVSQGSSFFLQWLQIRGKGRPGFQRVLSACSQKHLPMGTGIIADLEMVLGPQMGVAI